MRLARATASAVAVMLAAITVPAFAEDICSDEAVWTGSCGPSSTLTEDLMRRRVDRTLATDPAKDRVHRLNGSGTVPGVTPFAMTPDGDNTNFNTSLTQWGSSLSAADKAALEQAKTKFGDELTLPKPAEPVEPDFDIWAKGRRELFSEEGDIAKQGNALTTFVGADYRVRKEFLVGGMVQVDESRQTVLAAPDAVDGTAYMAGPYMAYRLSPNFIFDAKAAWGTAHDSAVFGEDNLAYATDRALSEARLTGSWGWNKWQLNQTGAITYLDESSAGIAGAPGTSVDVARFSVGPEIKRRIDAGNNKSIEPVAFFKSSLDLNDDGFVDPSAKNTVGGGVNLLKPNNFNISATADYTESGDAAVPGVTTGKVKVNVPLP